MAGGLAHPTGGGQSKALADQAAQMEVLHNRFLQVAKDSGNWDVLQVRSVAATDKFNRSLAEQKIGFMELIKSRELYNASLKQQIALQNSVVMKASGQSEFGKQSATLMVPKNLSSDLVSAEQRYGYLSKAIGSAAQQTVNWGKNTQWAGRQLTAGFSMPVLLAAAAVGKLAYDAEAQLTHVTKIYDYTSKNVAAQAAEEAQLRANSMNLASMAADKYGAKMNDVLQVEAQFAATGKTGNDLMQSTASVVRATTLTFQGASASAQDYQDVFKATIALQNIYKESAADVTKQFNYLNVVESQTSLRMKDVIDAIPRSLGPLKDLGVSFQQFTTMLVAMKQNGIPAAQGANALKSAAAGLLHVAPNTVTAFRQLHIDINQFVHEANGNVFDVLQRLSEAKRSMTNPDDTLQMEKALSLLFGKQQMARLTGVVDALGDIHNQATQVGRAYAVAGMSAEDMANKSDQQLKRLHDSLTGSLKRAIAGLQVELVKVGDAVLPVFTNIIKGVSGLVHWFGNLDPAIKKIALFAVGFGALIGPVIMLVGLFANAVGNIGKLSAAVTGLFYKFKILDPETKAAQTNAMDVNNVWDSQTRTAARLAASINELTATYKNLAVEQGLAMAINENGIGRMGSTFVKPGTNGRLQAVGPTGNPIPGGPGTVGSYYPAGSAVANAYAVAQQKSAQAVTEEEQRQVPLTEKIRLNTATTALGMASIATGLMTNNTQLSMWLGTASMASMVLSAIPFGRIGQGLTGMIAKIKAFTFSWEAMRAKSTAVAGMFGGWWALGAGVALAGAVLAVNHLNESMNKVVKDQAAINDSAKGWANILGYTYTEYQKIGGAMQGSVNPIAEDIALMKAMQQQEQVVIDKIRNASSEQEKLNLAIDEGVKVIKSGGDATQAYTAVRTALLAAGVASEQNIGDFMVKVHTQIDFGNQDDITTQLQQRLQSALDTAAKNVNNKGWWEAMTNDGASKNSVAAENDAANKFLQIIKDVKDNSQLATAFKQLQTQFYSSMNGAFSSAMEKDGEDMKKLGIKNVNDFMKVYSDYINNKLSDSQMNTFDELFNVRLSSGPLHTITDLDAALSQTVAQGRGFGADMSKGFYDIGQLAGYAVGNVDQLTSSIQNNTAAQSQNAKADPMIGATADQLGNSLQQAMSGTMDTIYQTADQMLQQHNQDVVNSIQASGDAQVKAIEKRGVEETRALDAQQKVLDRQHSVETKTLESYYSKKEKALKDSLKNEQHADSVRQKIFDNELKRIQRLAEAQNRSIDFNAALSSGNLDEAAKISNDGQAAVLQSQIDDQKQALQTQTQARQDALQTELDGISTAKDAAIQALKDKQDAETAALTAKKQKLQDEITAEKSAAQQITQTRIQAAQRQQKAQQDALNAELAALKAWIPSNTKDLNDHISQVEALYQKYGVNLQANGRQWANIVGSALTDNVKTASMALQNQIKWADIAKSITQQMAGVFGITSSDLIAWLKTGALPSSAGSSGGGKSGTHYGPSGQQGRFSSRHSGGPTWSQHDRVGVPRSANLYHSEFPTILKRGEYVMNEHAVARVGANTLAAMNNGKTSFRHSGGPAGIVDAFGGTLIASMYGRLMANQLGNAINNSMSSVTAGYGAGQAGQYGGAALDAGQLQNASIIMNVGRSMGASSRDMIVAIMTSLQESSLRNLHGGDRDSVGLFQQRPSQGWGSVAELETPTYAAHKFFDALMKVKDRNGMGMGEEAQAVQRSAFPGAYDQWASVAEAIVRGTPLTGFNGGWAGPAGSGQLQAPDSDGTPSYRGGWTSHLAPGIAQTVAQILASIPGGQVVTSAWRSEAEQLRINPGVPNSDHVRGKAVDIAANAYSADGSAMGDMIASAFAHAPGVRQVLWKTLVGGNHFNHVHVGFNHAGGFPQLKVGGEIQYDITIANLHRDETVLTAPLSKQLKDGIARIDSGTGTRYTVTIDMRGSNISNEIDFEKAVEKAIRNADRKVGLSRTVS